ncbi:hypothetical protein J4G37_17960 [Microvirga sp. 3-52]|nr:hypothetical protein [Microvirga sp. 3-52]
MALSLAPCSLVNCLGHTHHVMAGPDPAIPMLRGAALQAIGITGTRPVMTSAGPRAGPREPMGDRMTINAPSSRRRPEPSPLTV